MPEVRRDAFAVGLLALIPFAAVLGFDFAYDDHWTLVDNPMLDASFGDMRSALISGEAARRAFPDASRPTMVVSLWLDRHLFGGSAFAHHTVSLLLHALCSGLGYLLARVLLVRRLPALVAGALFALAPLHAEVVAAINYREDLLAAVGVFGALSLFLAGSDEARRSPRALLATFLLLFALGAKESALVFVPLALTLALLSERREGYWKEREGMLLGFASALILWGSWRHAVYRMGDGIPRASYASWGERLIASLHYEAWALLTQLFPFEARTLHEPLIGTAAVSALLVAAAFLALVLLRLVSPRRDGAFALAFLLLAPVVTSPLVGPVNITADRYLYIGVLGGAMIWGLLVERLERFLPPMLFRALILVTPLALGAVAFHEAAAWEDDITLFGRAVETSPESGRAWRDLSWARRRSGDGLGALEAAERAIALRPEDRHAVANRALALLALDRVEEARAIAVQLEALEGERAHGLGLLRQCLGSAGHEHAGCAMGSR